MIPRTMGFTLAAAVLLLAAPLAAAEYDEDKDECPPDQYCTMDSPSEPEGNATRGNEGSGEPVDDEDGASGEDEEEEVPPVQEPAGDHARSGMGSNETGDDADQPVSSEDDQDGGNSADDTTSATGDDGREAAPNDEASPEGDGAAGNGERATPFGAGLAMFIGLVGIAAVVASLNRR